MSAVKDFLNITEKEFNLYINSIDEQAVETAADIITSARGKGNRLHITGIGKPSHVANYAASLFSSTGTPTYFLHGTEAVHGSCGQLVEGDVVICISNSGETTELMATVAAIKNNGCSVISVTGNENSQLGKIGDVCLKAGVQHEGGVLNRAPRTSILAETLILQCLSVALQERVKITPEQYVKYHPGGALGKLRENEK